MPQQGHYAANCPQGDKGVSFQVSNGVSLTQRDVYIPQTWILLDTCSTISCCNSIELFSSIQECDHHVKVYTNGGSKTYNKIGNLKFLPLRAYYNPFSLANILSFAEVSKIPGILINIDTSIDNCFTLTYTIQVCLNFFHAPMGFTTSTAILLKIIQRLPTTLF